MGILPSYTDFVKQSLEQHIWRKCLENSQFHCQIKNYHSQEEKDDSYLAPVSPILWPSFCSLSSHTFLASGFLHILFQLPWILSHFYFMIQLECHSFEKPSLILLTETNLLTIYHQGTEYLSFVSFTTVVVLKLGILFNICPFPLVAPLRLKLYLLLLTTESLAPST